MDVFKKHSVGTFFALVFLLPWLVWGTTIAQQHKVLAWHIPQALSFWLGITTAVYLSASLSGGKRAVKDLLSRMVRAKVGARWYVIALLFIPVLALASMTIFKLFGGDLLVGKDITAASLPAVFLLELWLFLLTEETAWRGFVLPRLQSKYTPLIASLILGVAWALWHIPLFLIAGSFQSSIPYAGFVISTIATSIVMTWLFNHTRGSVLLAAMFHASTDVAIGYLGVMSWDRRLFWIFVVAQVVAAAIIARSKTFNRAVDRSPELIYMISE